MKPTRPQPSICPVLQDTHKKSLLKQARTAIECFLSGQPFQAEENRDPALTRKSGVFVTLLKNGDLRGCIGRIKDDLPLQEVVASMAVQAAFNDHRFAALTAQELPDIEIEISILSPLQKIESAEEIELGRHGVLLKKENSQALFLPQVAPKMGWDRKELLDRLCNKMGLPDGCWKRNAELFVFQTEVFSESEFR